ncbi:MAG: MATE family efflux transporter [Lachnospiraceae bacterium]|nr:MATE family efflux transporter [Lachnospiraceae bacterium]
MLVQALYNVVDTIFVSRFDSNALAALTLAFPMQNLMIALGAGTGVGVNAILSRSLGEKRQDRADASANTALLLSFFSFLLFFLIGIFFAEPFIRNQLDPTLEHSAVVGEYGAAYLGICCTYSFGIFFQVMFERLLQSTGRTFYSMISQMTGAVINIIFDPILIFGLLGFPRLGVAGAAYATVLGQCVAAVVGLVLNLKKNSDIHLELRSILKPQAEIVRQIYFVGVPSILMMSIGSVMTYLLDQILLSFETVGTTAVAVFGVYFRMQSFFFMPVFGLNNGLIPLLAYNYGARKRRRINEALRFALIMALMIMLTGTIVFETIPSVLLGLFNAGPELYEMGIPALRIIAVHFPIAAVCIIMGSIFQAFSKSYYSLFVSILRQLVALLPAAWLLAQTGVVNNVWFAFLVAEGTSLVFSLIFFRRVYRTTVAPLPEEGEEVLSFSG